MEILLTIKPFAQNVSFSEQFNLLFDLSLLENRHEHCRHALCFNTKRNCYGKHITLDWNSNYCHRLAGACMAGIKKNGNEGRTGKIAREKVCHAAAQKLLLPDNFHRSRHYCGGNDLLVFSWYL